MDKEEYRKEKIREYYKNNARKEKIVSRYKKIAQQDRINENYKKVKQIKKLVYKYRKLSEVRPIYRILNNLSIRINNELVKLGIKREFTYIQILGCSVNDFEEYLQDKMTEGMTYENYGDWEVDHIKPFSSFDFNDLEQIKICCHYSNLQPLWWLENKKKYNKIL